MSAHLMDRDQWRLLVENIADVIVRCDGALNRAYVSPAAKETLGYEPDELQGRSCLDLIHPDDCLLVEATLGRLGPAAPLLEQTFRMRRKDGSYIWLEARYRHMPDDGGMVAMLRDITARQAADEFGSAGGDELTGLVSRICFDSRLEQEFRRAQRQELPLGLVLIDVDEMHGFKDRYGPVAADDCLTRIARAATAALHRPGDIAARYDGERFGVLLPATDEAGAMLVADQIHTAVAGLGIVHDGSTLGIVTVSAGASAIIPVGAEDVPADLMAAAKLALYQAKLAGRNRVRSAVPMTCG